MNTMIPNKLKFDLDVNDLPARATKVHQKMEMLLGGNGCKHGDWFIPGTYVYSHGDAGGVCGPACQRAGARWWNGNWFTEHFVPGISGTVCGCCY